MTKFDDECKILIQDSGKLMKPKEIWKRVMGMVRNKKKYLGWLYSTNMIILFLENLRDLKEVNPKRHKLYQNRTMG